MITQPAIFARKLGTRGNANVRGFSINLRTRRKWDVQYVGKDGEVKDGKFIVYSIDEAMSSRECLDDIYNPRGRLMNYFVCEE